MDGNGTRQKDSMPWTLIAVVVLIVVIVLDAVPAHPITALQSVPLGLQDSPSATPTLTPPPSETIPPSTPLATLTPSQTLKAPPTFEPPTRTLAATVTPTVTLTPTPDMGISVEGLRGLETPTPSSTEGCVPRADWHLTYTIQANDTLTSISEAYNTTVWDLQVANCLSDADTIIIGQELRVPGEMPPPDTIECVPWEALTPPDGMITVPGSGDLTFNWRGPNSQLSLIRITKPDGEVIEELVEFRQNATINMADRIPDEGWYSWQVFPLDANFVQVGCKESQAWRFRKDVAEDEGGGNENQLDINEIYMLLTQLAP